MSFMSASSEDSWKTLIMGDTTAATYWLNWRVLLCSISLISSMIFAASLILRNEGFRTWRRGGSRSLDRPEKEQAEAEDGQTLYEEETWSPCLYRVHPPLLLAFRVVAFVVLLIMLVVISFVDGPSIYYYYTHSEHCCPSTDATRTTHGAVGEKVDSVDVDSEHGSCPAGTHSRHHSHASANTGTSSIGDRGGRKTASGWGYAFPIQFRMNAGAVVLTECFWFIIVPFLAINMYNLSILDIKMHSVNVVLLLGDTALNSLRFPLFRIGYFFVWTVIYVIFQWILHACVSIWWPYPFLNLSTPFAPLWYFSVALMHFPCYGIFSLVISTPS